MQLACDKIGSRILQGLWNHIDLKLKSQTATELCLQEAKVKSHMYGRHVHRELALFHFAKRKTDWEFIQRREQKKREMFKDVLESGKNLI